MQSENAGRGSETTSNFRMATAEHSAEEGARMSMFTRREASSVSGLIQTERTDTLRVGLSSLFFNNLPDDSFECAILRPFVFIFRGYHNKTPQAGRFKQQKFMFLQSWRLEMQDQGVGRFAFFCVLPLWFADGPLPSGDPMCFVLMWSVDARLSCLCVCPNYLL